MTVREILDNAYSIGGQFISNAVGIRLINQAVNVLMHRYDSTLPVKRIDIEVEDGMYELVDIIEIKSISKNDEKHKSYKIEGNTLLIDDGEYTLHAIEVPYPVETEHDEPDINELFHPIIELFVASRMPRPYDRELEQEFYMLADDIHYRLDSTKNKNFTLPKRIWR